MALACVVASTFSLVWQATSAASSMSDISAKHSDIFINVFILFSCFCISFPLSLHEALHFTLVIKHQSGIHAGAV